MWRFRALNFCFLLLVVTLLAIQHSTAVFRPGLRAHAAAGRDIYQNFAFPPGILSHGSVPAPEIVSRAAAFLRDAWNRGGVIKQWLTEFNTSRWEIFHASTAAETDLIEARFHIANAAMFTETTRERDRAIRELARAKTTLNAAQPLVEPRVARQLNNLIAEVAAAERREQAESPMVAVSFRKIETKLDDLMEIVRLSKKKTTQTHPNQG